MRRASARRPRRLPSLSRSGRPRRYRSVWRAVCCRSGCGMGCGPSVCRWCVSMPAMPPRRSRCGSTTQRRGGAGAEALSIGRCGEGGPYIQVRRRLGAHAPARGGGGAVDPSPANVTVEGVGPQAGQADRRQEGQGGAQARRHSSLHVDGWHRVLVDQGGGDGIGR